MNPRKSPAQAAASAPSELLRALLVKQTILIADSGYGGASGLKRSLVAIGAVADRVEAVCNWELAAQMLGSKAYGLVFGELQLGNRAFQEAIERRGPEGAPRSRFVVLSSNTSQALASEAVRGKFDAVLLKPYDGRILEAVLKRIFEEELNCPDYIKSIREGETALAQGDLGQASLCFTRALEQNRRPALAHACLARLAAQKGNAEAAIESFRRALQESQVHYSSLTGLEELLLKSSQKDETYSVVKRLALYYPMDPSRLALALRLAVETSSLDDLDEYYEIFKLLPLKPQTLLEHLCSALVVAGRHFLENHREKGGHELFEHVVALKPGSTRFLRRIVEILVLLEDLEQARHYLDLFPGESRASHDYIACEFLVSADPVDLDGLIQGAEKLLERGVRTPGLYEAMLKAHSRRRDTEAVARRLNEARKIWPHRTEDFEAAATASTVT
jgi:tetratricopeptide (TPR) repeat protein